MRAIFHIDESEKWEMTLKNVTNMINYAKEYQEKFLIEILANGNTVAELKEQVAKENGNYDKLKELADNAVDIVACKNALNASKIEEKELCTFVRVVPAGVVELVAKQSEGYAYIKP